MVATNRIAAIAAVLFRLAAVLVGAIPLIALTTFLTDDSVHLVGSLSDV